MAENFANVRIAIQKTRSSKDKGPFSAMSRKSCRNKMSRKLNDDKNNQTMLTLVKNYWHEKLIEEKSARGKFPLKRFENLCNKYEEKIARRKASRRRFC